MSEVVLNSDDMLASIIVFLPAMDKLTHLPLVAKAWTRACKNSTAWAYMITAEELQLFMDAQRAETRLLYQLKGVVDRRIPITSIADSSYLDAEDMKFLGQLRGPLRLDTFIQGDIQTQIPANVNHVLLNWHWDYECKDLSPANTTLTSAYIALDPISDNDNWITFAELCPNITELEVEHYDDLYLPAFISLRLHSLTLQSTKYTDICAAIDHTTLPQLRTLDIHKAIAPMLPKELKLLLSYLPGLIELSFPQPSLVRVPNNSNRYKATSELLKICYDQPVLENIGIHGGVVNTELSLHPRWRKLSFISKDKVVHLQQNLEQWSADLVVGNTDIDSIDGTVDKIVKNLPPIVSKCSVRFLKF
jgi:hypothetical protein